VGPEEAVSVTDLNRIIRDAIESMQRSLMLYVHYNSDEPQIYSILGGIKALEEFIDSINRA